MMERGKNPSWKIFYSKENFLVQSLAHALKTPITRGFPTHEQQSKETAPLHKSITLRKAKYVAKDTF